MRDRLVINILLSIIGLEHFHVLNNFLFSSFHYLPVYDHKHYLPEKCLSSFSLSFPEPLESHQPVAKRKAWYAYILLLVYRLPYF